MKEKRKIEVFGHYFYDFYNKLSEKVKDKIDYVLCIIETSEIIPTKFFKHMKTTGGLYEIRVKYADNSYRIFCCFDKEKLIVLFSGFQKKTQKTPQEEIKKALKIKELYFKNK